MRNLLSRLFLPFLLVFSLSVSTTSCTLLHTSLAPDAVVIAVDLRSDAWEQIAFDWPASDAVLVDALKQDSTSWGLLAENAGFMASSKYKAVVQSQKIATKVAAVKIDAGDYTDAEKLELVQALLKAWDNLEGYYHPTLSEEE